MPAKVTTKIELNEVDIKEIVASHYGLDINTAKISVNYYAGDAREPSYLTVIVEGCSK